jgi:membrane protease YdiL (CAAX protease family)
MNTVYKQHPIGLSVALHLAPGILVGTAFFLLGPFVQRLGLPPFMALCIADLVVLLPLVYGYLLFQGHQQTGRYTLDGVVLYREKVRGWEYLVFVPIVFFASGLLVLALSPVSNSIFKALFSWWPAMYDLGADLSAYSRSALIFSYIVNFLVVTLAAPITEEIYFRGYLLPRLSRFGLWAIPINSILFGLFHVWSPWMAVARAVGLIPLIFVTLKKQNIYIGMLAHILVNSLDVVTGVMFIIKHF